MRHVTIKLVTLEEEQNGDLRGTYHIGQQARKGIRKTAIRKKILKIIRLLSFLKGRVMWLWSWPTSQMSSSAGSLDSTWVS